MCEGNEVPWSAPVLVGVAINYSLESTSECRQLVGQLFHKLLEDGTLAVDKMVAGCVCVYTNCHSFLPHHKCAHLAYDLWDALVTVYVVLLKFKELYYLQL